MKVTLADVAKEAGVSRATVDRVLNDRGNVRNSTVERVYRALYSTNYLLEPDEPSAARGVSYRFDFVIPVAHEDVAFFQRLQQEIQALAPHFHQLNASISVHSVDHESPSKFAEKVLAISSNSDGIAFAAPDHPIVRNAINTIVDKGVGIVSLISDISGTKRHGYTGVDNRAAGRTAGLLMGRFLSNHKSGKIALFTGSHYYRGNEEREAGFKSMIRERFSDFQVIVMPEMHDDNELSKQLTQELIKKEASLVGIYNDVGGGSVGIVNALKDAERDKDIVFIAHELNPTTQKFLLEGTIDVIIDQGLKHQVYNAVEMLVHHKRHQEVSDGILQPQFEIYLSENIV